VASVINILTSASFDNLTPASASFGGGDSRLIGSINWFKTIGTSSNHSSVPDIPHIYNDCMHNGYTTNTESSVPIRNKYSCENLTQRQIRRIALKMALCHIYGSGRKITFIANDSNEIEIANALKKVYLAPARMLNIDEMITYHQFVDHLLLDSPETCDKLSNENWMKDVVITASMMKQHWKSMMNKFDDVKADVLMLKNDGENLIQRITEQNHLHYERMKLILDELKEATLKSLTETEKLNNMYIYYKDLPDVTAHKVHRALLGLREFMPYPALLYFIMSLNCILLFTPLLAMTRARPLLYKVAILECILEISFHWLSFFNLTRPFLYLVSLRFTFIAVEVFILIYNTCCLESEVSSETLSEIRCLVRHEMMKTIIYHDQEMRRARE